MAEPALLSTNCWWRSLFNILLDYPNWADQPTSLLHDHDDIAPFTFRSSSCYNMPPLTRRCVRAFLCLFVLICISLTHLHLHHQPQPHQQLLPNNPPPYFHEQSYLSTSKCIGAVSHADVRFARPLNTTELHTSLQHLIHSFTQLMDTHHLTFWLAHGTLIGYHFSGKMLPWNTDLDVQVTASTMRILAKEKNATWYRFVTEDGEERRYFWM